MKALAAPYTYQLNNHQPTSIRKKHSTLFFVEMEADENGVYRTKHDGTTNEEVLKALIHRLKILNEKSPCRQNELALDNLAMARMWLDDRTRERKARGVEGTTAK